MESRGSMPHSQGLSNNPYSELREREGEREKEREKERERGEREKERERDEILKTLLCFYSKYNQFR